ncbi:MAG: DUF2236 domain-containing protein [Actinobacteria bacterium]|nr:DUF2236 domain-containing protein [Actinomycetota bacterium]
MIKDRIANRFREIVSGSPDGMPDWVRYIDMGEGPGNYGPDSAVWEVHGCIATLVGGIRALLLQAAHPAALAGVAQHSRYEKDFLGRLAGTARWLTITTFATQEAIDREAARVNAMHSHVSGQYQNKEGEESTYKATDPRFLLWVHCAFTESFLKAHLALGYPIKAGADAYIREWSTSAKGLGLTNAPKSQAELDEVMQDFVEHDLMRSAKTDEVVKFILRPPVGRASLFFYSILANAAIASLSDAQRDILGLKKVSRFWLFLCRRILNFLSAVLGQESPSQQIARRRIARS